MVQLPNDIIIDIFMRSKLKNIIGHNSVDKFIIDNIYPSSTNIFNLLYILVVKKRYISVGYLLNKININNTLDVNLIIRLIIISLREYDIEMASNIFKRFHKYIEHKNATHIIYRCIFVICKDKHGIYTEDLLSFIELVCKKNIDISLPLSLIQQLLRHSNSRYIIKTLISYDIIGKLTSWNLNKEYNYLIKNIIISNNVELLELQCYNGLSITINDITLGITFANLEMITFLISRFKPRFFTLGFANHMLLLSCCRDKTVFKLIKQQLCEIAPKYVHHFFNSYEKLL
jgi:hypothetical protein